LAPGSTNTILVLPTFDTATDTITLRLKCSRSRTKRLVGISFLASAEEYKSCHFAYWQDSQPWRSFHQRTTQPYVRFGQSENAEAVWHLSRRFCLLSVLSFCPDNLLNVFRFRSSLAIHCTDEREMPVCHSISRRLLRVPGASSWLQISFSTLVTFAAVFTGWRRPRPMTPSTGNPASIVLMSRLRLDLHQALLANSFRKQRELQFFSTHNAFITILSSRVILLIKMHKCGYYSAVLFL